VKAPLYTSGGWSTAEGTQAFWQKKSRDWHAEVIMFTCENMNHPRTAQLRSKSLMSVRLHASYIPAVRGVVCDANLTRQYTLACFVTTRRCLGS